MATGLEAIEFLVPAPSGPTRNTAATKNTEGSEGFAQVLGNVWLGGRDSNPDTQIQSLQSYH